MAKTGFTKSDRVVEIGAGKGHATVFLAQRCADVSAVEIDRKFIPILKNKLARYDNVKIICADFLSLSLPEEPYKIYSNLPFCIMTPCLLKLLRAENPPEEAWLITERGAALRWLGKPENARSMLLKTVFSGSIEMKIDRFEFHPAPSCDAVLLRLEKKSDVMPRDERLLFEGFTARAYENLRRGKTPFAGMLTQKQISRALRDAGLPAKNAAHGEELYIQWLCLFRCFRRFGSN